MGTLGIYNVLNGMNRINNPQMPLFLARLLELFDRSSRHNNDLAARVRLELVFTIYW